MQKMADDPVIQANPLGELLGWLDELEHADSYSGFTFNDWMSRRPADAIQALKANAKGTGHG